MAALRKLTIVFVSEELPPETGWGGIGTYTHTMAHALAALGHRVHVIARTWQAPAVHEDAGVSTHRISMPEPSWRRGTWFINTRFAESRHVAVWAKRVREELQAIARVERIDVIESPEYHAQALRLAEYRDRLVIRLHTPAVLCRELNGVRVGSTDLDQRIAEHLECRVARRARLITSPSARLAADVDSLWRLRDSVVVVPNPVDDQIFGTTPVRSEHTEVVYVGRLERRKGVHVLARALVDVIAAFPRTHVRFVGADHPSAPGGGSMREHLREVLRKGGERVFSAVEFVDAVPRERLPAIYATADICVVPSLYENFPYTCLEAMAAGCAVVSTNVGGIPEIISHGRDGWLVAPDDVEQLAGALRMLMDDPVLSNQLSTAARRTVKARFAPAAVSRSMTEAYLSIVASRPAGRLACA